MQEYWCSSMLISSLPSFILQCLRDFVLWYTEKASFLVEKGAKKHGLRPLFGGLQAPRIPEI